ncbi:hypothetical protein BDD12DRAFT_830739, partial [Trichophaea hybrida]
MYPLLYRFVRSTPRRLFCLAGPFTRRPYSACSTSQQHHLNDSPRRQSLTFLELRTKGVAYFDRTRYITTIDSCDEALLFLRPRRFGKSLTLSMLHYFHGVEHKNTIKAFKDLDVDKDVQDKKISLIIDQPTNACVSLQNCVELVIWTLQEVIDQDKKIYVLIDEYDSFSNAHININPTSPNWNAMYPAGTIKSFYATMKSCTGPLQLVRYFITGVSPVALADVSRKLPSHDSADSVEKELSHLTDFVNGYHFCANGKVDTVFNTTTCMEYFQRRLEKETFALEDPPHSEVNENFLSICASSPIARSNLDEALNGLRWFTFDSNNPSKYLKIPNQIAARRIATVVLHRYGLIACKPVNYSILKNVLLTVQPEFKVTQNTTLKRSLDVLTLVITHERHVTVIEWKVIKIDFLEIEDITTSPNTKFVKFGRNDKWRRGKTIEEWVHGSDGDSPQSQITQYFKSPEITKLVNDKVRQFRGHLVIVVGNRKILVWDVDDGGILGD